MRHCVQLFPGITFKEESLMELHGVIAHEGPSIRFVQRAVLCVLILAHNVNIFTTMRNRHRQNHSEVATSIPLVSTLG